MTSDSHLFRTAEELDNNGYFPVQGNRWKKGEDLYLPLYQGRMIHQFDHRANSVQVNPENTHNPYFSVEVSETEHADPSFLPQTRYWAPSDEVEKEVPKSNGWFLAFRDVARTNDRRTMIVAVLPWVGCGHKVPLLLPATANFGADSAALLIGNLNCISLDYVIRQKMQSTNVAWYIVEQLPVIAPADYDRAFGATTARDLVRHHVLRLTYTAHDMAPFARDLGYHGPPFIWKRRRTPPPARPPRRPLLPPLRPLKRRRRLHPRHLPHRPPPRQSCLRHLPHQTHGPRLLQRPRRRRHRCRRRGLGH